MDFGAYVLSTVNGFKSKPFGVRAVWQILAGEESQLDLNSAFGLKAGDSIMRYQRIPISGKNIHAYSIYQGAMEPNAGRNGTFIGLSLIFEEKIDAQEIALGQRLCDLLDGLSQIFIQEKRFIKTVDSKTIEEFCNDDDYHEIMTDILDKGKILSNVVPVSLKKKNAFYCAKQDIYDSFNEICNSEAADDQFYLVSNTTGSYRAIAKNLAIHVSDWPIPSPPVLIKKISEGKKFTYPPTKPIKLSGLSVETPQKNKDDNKNKEGHPFLKFYNLSSILKTAGTVFVSVLTGCLLMFFFDPRGKVQQQVAHLPATGTPYRSEDTVSKVKFDALENKVDDLLSQVSELKNKLTTSTLPPPSGVSVSVQGAQQPPAATTGTPPEDANNAINEAIKNTIEIANDLIGIYQKNSLNKNTKQRLENIKRDLEKNQPNADNVKKRKIINESIESYREIITNIEEKNLSKEIKSAVGKVKENIKKITDVIDMT